ncbi:UNKNOWN [Stylonychia lemnae]|uniref:Uncharacterized protein n=1 Tax=Stylonychia lemnae TaxID=5949 RepID=A0A078AZD3_STYLE|nr:UNKNOWN [Stylonychia lemnae]|eukprot:CDW87800.1 UNKNOWN [Stylonychia lemnae]
MKSVQYKAQKQIFSSGFFFAMFITDILTQSCLGQIFPLYWQGQENEVHIHSFDIDPSENIALGGYSTDAEVTGRNNQYQFPVIAMITEGGTYKWAKVQNDQDSRDKKFVVVRFDPNHQLVIGMTDGVKPYIFQINTGGQVLSMYSLLDLQTTQVIGDFFISSTISLMGGTGTSSIKPLTLNLFNSQGSYKIDSSFEGAVNVIRQQGSNQQFYFGGYMVHEEDLSLRNATIDNRQHIFNQKRLSLYRQQAIKTQLNRILYLSIRDRLNQLLNTLVKDICGYSALDIGKEFGVILPFQRKYRCFGQEEYITNVPTFTIRDSTPSLSTQIQDRHEPVNAQNLNIQLQNAGTNIDNIQCEAPVYQYSMTETNIKMYTQYSTEVKQYQFSQFTSSCLLASALHHKEQTVLKLELQKAYFKQQLLLQLQIRYLTNINAFQFLAEIIIQGEIALSKLVQSVTVIIKFMLDPCEGVTVSTNKTYYTVTVDIIDGDGQIIEGFNWNQNKNLNTCPYQLEFSSVQLNMPNNIDTQLRFVGTDLQTSNLKSVGIFTLTVNAYVTMKASNIMKVLLTKEFNLIVTSRCTSANQCIKPDSFQQSYEHFLYQQQTITFSEWTYMYPSCPETPVYKINGILSFQSFQSLTLTTTAGSSIKYLEPPTIQQPQQPSSLIFMKTPEFRFENYFETSTKFLFKNSQYIYNIFLDQDSQAEFFKSYVLTLDLKDSLIFAEFTNYQLNFIPSRSLKDLYSILITVQPISLEYKYKLELKIHILDQMTSSQETPNETLSQINSIETLNDYSRLKNKKFNKIITVKLASISIDGIATLQFNDTLLLPKNLSYLITNETLILQVIDSNTELVDFDHKSLLSFEVLSYNKKQLKLKLKFKDPRYISQSQRPDKLRVTFKKSYFYVNQLITAKISDNQVLTRNLPSQIYDSGISSSSNNGEFISLISCEIFNETLMENDGCSLADCQSSYYECKSTQQCVSLLQITYWNFLNADS